MTDYTYEPGLLLDPDTLEPVRSGTVSVTPSTGGAATQVYDLTGQAITLQTNSKGYWPSFRVTGLAVAQLSSGDVALVTTSVEARDSGLQAAAAQAAAQAAQTAAQAAQQSAALAVAPTMTAVATAVATAGAARDAVDTRVVILGGTISVVWNAAQSRWETLTGTVITARSDITARTDVMVRWCGGTTATPPPGMTATTVNPAFPNDTWTRADNTVLAGWQAGAALDAFRAKLLAFNPELLLPLDETAGTVAVDSSTHGRNGTYSGTYTLGQPNPELASGGGVQLRISPTIGKVTVPHSAGLNLGTTAAERWIAGYFYRPDIATPTYQNAVGKGNEGSTTAGSRGYAFWHGPTSSAQFKCAGTQYGPDPLNYGSEVLGQTYLIIWTFDGSRVRFYRDGVLRFTSAVVTALTCDTTAPLTLGTSATDTAMNGMLGSAVIAHVCPTDAQVADLASLLTITPPVTGGTGGSGAQPFSAPGTPIASKTWTSVWSAEFDDPADLGTKFVSLTGDQPPNGTGSASNMRVANSLLSLWSTAADAAHHNAYIGYVGSEPARGATDGHLLVVGEYVEYRIFCRGPNPTTGYNWDAAWADSASGHEIDAFELLTNGAGNRDAHVVFHQDWNTQNSNTEIAGSWFNRFTIVGIDRRTADATDVYYDGVLVKTLDTSAGPHKTEPQTLLLNSGQGLAMGEAFSFDVDWVRVWS